MLKGSLRSARRVAISPPSRSKWRLRQSNRGAATMNLAIRLVAALALVGGLLCAAHALDTAVAQRKTQLQTPSGLLMQASHVGGGNIRSRKGPPPGQPDLGVRIARQRWASIR